jgi:hypothetical protein|tara:strand:+ start:1250 stop:1588 length:339 start_codon:yes stop_codon:yes gene_type:complete
MSEKRLGRNDPCHCDSGKKYKNCHWEEEKSAKEQQTIDPVKALQDFKDRWEKMGIEERLETVLAMNMNLAYRLDILATIVSSIPGVKGMDQFIQDLPIAQPEEKQKSKANGG